MYIYTKYLSCDFGAIIERRLEIRTLIIRCFFLPSAGQLCIKTQEETLHNRNAYIEQHFFLSDKLVQTGNTASFMRTVAEAEAGSRSSHTAEDSHSLRDDSKTSSTTAVSAQCTCSLQLSTRQNNI